MSVKYVPKVPWRHNFQKEFSETTESLRVGIIQRVDEINLKADIKIITGQAVRTEVNLSQAMCGPRSFWGGIPEVGSLVLIGFKEISKKNKLTEPVILGYVPVGSRLGLRFDPFSSVDPSSLSSEEAADLEEFIGGVTRYKRLKMYPGDVGGMSAAGSELLLNQSVSMVNRAGDLIELRDEERTLVTQAVHRFDNQAGVRRYLGPVRRQTFWLPREVLTTTGDTKTLLSESEGYFGRDDLQAVGPGAPEAETKFADASGVLQEFFNNPTDFPPVTYSNGKTVFYPSTVAGQGIEGQPGKAGSAFTEVRTELYHDTEPMQEVTTEIDGFQPNPRVTYIEQVLGTVVGNDPYSTQGVKQYGQVLMPQIWTSGKSMSVGKFTMEAVPRGLEADIGVRTSAAAYLFRINPVETKGDDTPFAAAVDKQGKFFLQVPKPSKEPYNDSVKGVSVEANLMGALKMFVGAASPTNTSLYAKFAGGIKAEIGRNTDTGNSLDIVFAGPVKNKYVGATDDRGNGLTTTVNGNQATTVSGDYNVQTGGSVNLVASGTLTSKGDKIVHQAISGYTLNSAGYQATISGMTYLTYAQLKTETIATGGEVKTVVVGAVTETLSAGAKTLTVNGAITNSATASITETAGAAYTQNAGGAFTVSAGAAYSLTAGAAVSITAAAMITQTAPAGISLVSANIMLGGPTAALGVARATPSLPPGVPTLDYITGLPLLGSAGVRSI